MRVANYVRNQVRFHQFNLLTLPPLILSSQQNENVIKIIILLETIYNNPRERLSPGIPVGNVVLLLKAPAVNDGRGLPSTGRPSLPSILPCPGEQRKSCSSVVRVWKDTLRPEGDTLRDKFALCRLTSVTYGQMEGDTS